MWFYPPWLHRPVVESDLRPRPANERGIGREILLLVIDKLLLAVLAATVLLVVQHYMQESERKLERARQIADIAVTQPLAIASRIPESVNAFRLYVTELRVDATELDNKRLTELQVKIASDVQLAKAWYSEDGLLAAQGAEIIRGSDELATRAAAKTLNDDDVDLAQLILEKAHAFHARAVELSRRRALRNVDRAYEDSAP